MSLQGIQMQWILNAYLLPLATLSLLGSADGDKIGRRRALLLGAMLFSMAAMVCASVCRDFEVQVLGHGQ